MANRFPLVLDTTDGNKIKELPAGDNLNLRENSIINVQDVNALGTINAAIITVNGERLVAQSFADLTDTPSSFAGAEDYFVKVNATGDALEFRPISDIGNIDLDTLTVTQSILPATVGDVNIGNNDFYFNRVTANEFKGDLISGTDERVFNAGTGKLAYAALDFPPQFLSEFTDDIGFLRAADLDSSLSSLFDEGVPFNTDIQGSVFGDDSTLLIDGVASKIRGDIEFEGTGFIQGDIIAILPNDTVDLGETKLLANIRPENDNGGSVGLENTRFGFGYFTTLNSTTLESEGIEVGETLGVGVISSPTDLEIGAGNRVKITGNIPLNINSVTLNQRSTIAPISGDIVYNTSSNGFNFYQGGNWITLHSGDFSGDLYGSLYATDGTLIYNATVKKFQGLAVENDATFEDNVVIQGNLTVTGTTTSVNTTNTEITDNTIVLNNGETGAGVTAGTSGIEIDRGVLTNASFVFREDLDHWFTVNPINAPEFTSIGGIIIQTGGFNSEEQIELTTNGANGSILLNAPNIMLNGDFVDQISAVAGVKGDLLGSVYADDSTILVDGVNAKIVGTVDTDNVTASGTVTATGVVTNEVTRQDGGNLRFLSSAGGSMDLIATGINVTSSDDIEVSTTSVTGNASNIFVETGDSTSTGAGGTININAGRAETGNGGSVNISGGNTTTGLGGTVEIRGGTSFVEGAGGDIILVAGNNASESVGGSDHGGDITLTAGLSVNGEGGDITITSGSSTNASGGNLSVDAGPGTSAAFNGELNIGTSYAKNINVGNANSTTTFTGDVNFGTSLFVNNIIADDSISITTATGDGNAINLGPGGTNTSVNLTADAIRFFGPVTSAISATGGITGDLTGSVFGDDSTAIVDAVNNNLNADTLNISTITSSGVLGINPLALSISSQAGISVAAGAGPLSLASDGSAVYMTGNSGAGSISYNDADGAIILATTGLTRIEGAAGGNINIGTGTSGTVTLGHGGNTIALNGTVDFSSATVAGLNVSGDVKGSVFADDSSVMVDAVNFTMFSDIMTLTPLNSAPDPVEGMMVIADRVNWDPVGKGSGNSYPVYFDGSVWNALY